MQIINSITAAISLEFIQPPCMSCDKHDVKYLDYIYHVGECVLLTVVSTTTTTTTPPPVTDDNSYVHGPVIISTSSMIILVMALITKFLLNADTRKY